ncbi:DUF6261 family protein [Mangrovibacterium lignilyticum]|uniref:DUF6261 family protein n=1 Tax=Mangrovibacterium lignilyticum TaxID=2668052 RepID=UPI0013D0F9B7|nr:DUF6261 family protein [Mangrovibacterium lignilyticum]
MRVLKLSNKCRNSEANATTGRISKAYHEGTLATNVALAAIFGEIDPKNQELTSAIKRQKAESDLEVKDEQRDADHHALYHLLYGATFNPDAVVKAAALQVFSVLEYYGLSVTDENYDTETSYLNSLLEDLGKADLQVSIAAIVGCSDLIDALQASQDTFDAAKLAFQQEQAQEGQLQSATAIKRALIPLLNNKLVTFLNGMLVADEATYGEYAATVNQIIEATNETVKKRGNTINDNDEA